MAGIGDLFTPPTAVEQTGRILLDTLVGAANVNRAALENAERMIWENPYGMTPQEVFALLGTRAVALLRLKAQILPLLQVAFADSPPVELKPEGVTLTENEDGTVTVVEG